MAIGLHNLPEGLATFVGALADPTAGVVIAIAIALHNIPEVRQARWAGCVPAGRAQAGTRLSGCGEGSANGGVSRLQRMLSAAQRC